jgi:hypothetical protein
MRKDITGIILSGGKNSTTQSYKSFKASHKLLQLQENPVEVFQIFLVIETYITPKKSKKI